MESIHTYDQRGAIRPSELRYAERTVESQIIELKRQIVAAGQLLVKAALRRRWTDLAFGLNDVLVLIGLLTVEWTGWPKK